MLHYLKEFPQSQYSFRDSSTLYFLSETQEEVFSECSCDDVRKSEEQIEKSGPSQLDDVRSTTGYTCKDDALMRRSSMSALVIGM